MTNKKLMLLFLDWKQLFFLDWKQAFESLDHTAMLEALHRFGLSDRMMRSSKSFHENLPLSKYKVSTTPPQVRFRQV